MLSRVIRVGTTLAVLGLVTATAVAQPGGQRGPGGFGGGRGMGPGAGGGATELMALLAAPEVRKEVKLSDEAYAAVEKQQQELRESMRGAFAGFGRDASDADREKARAEMSKRMKESNEKAQALLDEVLPPEGLDRLIGLYVQLRGDSSVTGELPAKKVGLSEDDKKKIDEAVQKIRQEAFGQGGRAEGERPSPEQMQARFAEMRKKSDEAALTVMTDAQRKALADLKGAKFEFPESMRNRGGFGGPGGPGGQGGRRGGRPAGE